MNSFFAFPQGIKNPSLLRAACAALVIAATLGPGAARGIDHMREVPYLPDDPLEIDWSTLPRLENEVGTVFTGIENEAAFNLHSYLAYYDDQFWAIWSSGYVSEDQPGQIVRYATSPDGLNWSEAGQVMAPQSKQYISRGLWVRDGELLALASYGYFGTSLELQAYKWNVTTENWDFECVVADDTMNNFPPKQLPTGEWMMSRRDSNQDVSVLIGGVSAIDDWTEIPMPTPVDGHRMSEPNWYTLPDGRQAFLFRDASGSKRLYRSFSEDNGRTWTAPEQTDYPDATAKFNTLQTSRGDFVLVGNPNPRGRIPLALATSDDGVLFTDMAILRDEPTSPRYPGGAKFDGYHYPNLLEHDGYLYVIHSENKEDIMVSKLPLPEIESPPQIPPQPPIIGQGPNLLVNGDYEDTSGTFPAGWELVTGAPDVHAGLGGTTTAAWLSAGNVRISQEVIDCRRDWALEMLVAAEDPGEASERALNLILDLGDGPHINLRINGDGDIQTYDVDWRTILDDGIAFSVDANADGDFDDAGDTLNVHRLRIARDSDDANYAYTVSLSEAGSEEYSLVSDPVSYFNGGSPATSTGLTSITVKSDRSAGSFVADELSVVSLIRANMGDLNADGFVGGEDLDLVRSFWGQEVTPGDRLSGDPSGDGFVGGDDLDLIRANWGQGTPPHASAVPEPGTMMLLVGMALSGLVLARIKVIG